MSAPDEPDERLLLPATRALLKEWCGPVVVRGLSPFYDGPAVLLGPDTREPSERAGDWSVYLEDGCEVASVSPDEIRLDLSRAECRDRVVRVVHHTMVRFTPTLPEDYSERMLPSLATLDPDDDTRLPDGSRLVDALSLALVARHVLGVDRG